MGGLGVNGGSQPPAPQPPPTFSFLSLTLLFFSKPLSSESPLLLFLLIITCLLPHLLITPSSQISSRYVSKYFSSLSLFPDSVPSFLFASDLSCRLLFYLVLSQTLRSTSSLRYAAVFNLVVMMALGFISTMMVLYALKVCSQSGGFMAYRSISSIYSSWPSKVFTSTLSPLNPPTTSLNTIAKGHTNTQVLRVYKYPRLVTFTNQVRFVLTIALVSHLLLFASVLILLLVEIGNIILSGSSIPNNMFISVVNSGFFLWWHGVLTEIGVGHCVSVRGCAHCFGGSIIFLSDASAPSHSGR